MEIPLDKKDYEILRILDENFRIPFSQIAKKVNLSKNTISLRFNRLKELMLHNTTGINNRFLGYTLVRVFYTMDLDNRIENEIISEIRKHKNIIQVAKYYGHYNIEISLFVKTFEELINDVEAFNKRFSKEINQKDIQIIAKEFYLRNNFIHQEPINRVYKILETNEKYDLTNSEKKILSLLRKDPRMSIIEINKKSNLNPKTIAINMKSLENKGVIMGYFMMLDNSKFNLSIFKILIQTTNSLNEEEFENYLTTIKNIKHFSKTLGLWDYEIDFVYPSVLDLQKQIELIKQKFHKQIKKIEIIIFDKRIATNKEKFLL